MSENTVLAEAIAREAAGKALQDLRQVLVDHNLWVVFVPPGHIQVRRGGSVILETDIMALTPEGIPE